MTLRNTLRALHHAFGAEVLVGGTFANPATRRIDMSRLLPGDLHVETISSQAWAEGFDYRIVDLGADHPDPEARYDISWSDPELVGAADRTGFASMAAATAAVQALEEGWLADSQSRTAHVG